MRPVGIRTRNPSMRAAAGTGKMKHCDVQFWINSTHENFQAFLSGGSSCLSYGILWDNDVSGQTNGSILQGLVVVY
jgi:hypothetical protein